ncbi:MAG: hypothetical protein P8189_24185 [Anaerolineae bacterium]
MGTGVDVVCCCVVVKGPALDDANDVVVVQIIVPILQPIADPVVRLTDDLAQIPDFVVVVAYSLERCDFGHVFQLPSACIVNHDALPL